MVDTSGGVCPPWLVNQVSVDNRFHCSTSGFSGFLPNDPEFCPMTPSTQGHDSNAIEVFNPDDAEW